MKSAISLITLGVEDLERSFNFYTKTIGWKTTSKLDDGVIFFQLLGIIFGLWPRTELAKDSGLTSKAGGFPRFSLAQNLSNEQEVDACFASLKEKSVTITK